MRPAEVFPLKDFVHEELAARGWSVDDLVAASGAPPETELALRLLLEDGRPGMLLDAETADALARALNTSADFWLRLDRQFQEFARTS